MQLFLFKVQVQSSLHVFTDLQEAKVGALHQMTDGQLCAGHALVLATRL